LCFLEVPINQLSRKWPKLLALFFFFVRRAPANLLGIFTILTDNPRRESEGSLTAGQQATVRSSELQSKVRLRQENCLPAFTYITALLVTFFSIVSWHQGGMYHCRLSNPKPLFVFGLYSSVAEHQSCKLKVLGSIPSGGFFTLLIGMCLYHQKLQA
jgi:hypothetical protein